VYQCDVFLNKNAEMQLLQLWFNYYSIGADTRVNRTRDSDLDRNGNNKSRNKEEWELTDVS